MEHGDRRDRSPVSYARLLLVTDVQFCDDSSCGGDKRFVGHVGVGYEIGSQIPWIVSGTCTRRLLFFMQNSVSRMTWHQVRCLRGGVIGIALFSGKRCEGISSERSTRVSCCFQRIVNFVLIMFSLLFIGTRGIGWKCYNWFREFEALRLSVSWNFQSPVADRRE